MPTTASSLGILTTGRTPQPALYAPRQPAAKRNVVRAGGPRTECVAERGEPVSASTMTWINSLSAVYVLAVARRERMMRCRPLRLRT